MENLSSWRSFADALGYLNLPLTFFCRSELDSEPERVASVLEKLKEDCNNTENKDRKSFQKELMMVSPRSDEGIFLPCATVRVIGVNGS